MKDLETKEPAAASGEEFDATGFWVPPRAPAKVLLVEADESTRARVVGWLEGLGYVVTAAADGPGALDALLAAPVDVALLGVRMAGLDGAQVLARLQEMGLLQRMRVLMVAGADELDIVMRCIELGADDHLTRPIEATSLNAHVEACLARKRRWEKEQRHARRLERELEIGREIQASFLPDSLPNVHGWELGARLRPARAVSGDFYDLFSFEEGGRLGIIVADVCDKGVGAALFMALFRTLLRAASLQRYGGLIAGGVSFTATGLLALTSQVAEYSAAGKVALESAIRLTNNYMARTHGNANMFATVFFGVLEPVTGTLDYVNCGHEPPVVRRAKGEMLTLGRTGVALGLLPDTPFEVKSVQLGHGDLLFAFTDGVTEAQGAAKALFGLDQLLTILNAPSTSTTQVLERVEAAIRAHTSGRPQSDDITLVAVRRSTAG